MVVQHVGTKPAGNNNAGVDSAESSDDSDTGGGYVRKKFNFRDFPRPPSPNFLDRIVGDDEMRDRKSPGPASDDDGASSDDVDAGGRGSALS